MKSRRVNIFPPADGDGKSPANAKLYNCPGMWHPSVAFEGKYS